MKHTFFFFLLSVFSFRILAQDATVTFGEQMATKGLSGSTSLILGQDKSGFFVLRMDGVAADDAQMALLQDNPGMGLAMTMLIGIGVIDDDHRLFDIESYMGTKNANMFAKVKLSLQKYDKDCKQIWAKPFAPQINGEDMRLKNILLINGQLYLFASTFNKEAFKTTLYWTKFKEDGTLENKYTKISEVTGKNSAFTNMTNAFRVIPSADNSSVLVYYHQNTEKNSIPQKIGLKMLDGSMTELWNKTYPVSFGENKFSITKQMIAKDGGVYIVAKVAATSDDKKGGKKSFSFTILKAGKDLTALKKIDVDVPGKLVTDLYMDESSGGTLKLFGFYSEKSAKKAGGAYVYTVTPEFTLGKKSAKDFTEKVIGDVLGSDEDADKKPELGNIHIRKVFPNSDGTYTIVAENYQILTGKGDYGSINFSYHYYDIPLFRVNDDASIEWATAVHKKQKSSNDGANMLSCVCQYSNDNIYLIFNGGRKAMEKMMWNPDNAMVYCSKIDGTGKVTSSPLYSTKETDFTVVPKTSYLLSDNQIVLYTVDGLKYKFARVDLK